MLVRLRVKSCNPTVSDTTAVVCIALFSAPFFAEVVLVVRHEVEEYLFHRCDCLLIRESGHAK